MATSFIQEINIPFHSRKLLLYPSFNQSSPSALTSLATPPGSHDLLQPLAGGNSFDADVILVLTVLFCALICSIGLNLVIRCAFKCSRLASHDHYLGNGNNLGSNNGKLANPGINKKALKTIPVVSYSPDSKLPGLESECVICLMEFSAGKKIRVLPKCKHGFHVKCIDRWLSYHSSCPTCRHSLIETCNMTLDCGNSNVSQSSIVALPPGPPRETIISIATLEPEGMVGNYQT